MTISELTVEFGSGMTALTGETGAGKSILIDALGLVLGARASATLLADGADRTEITASFEVGQNQTLRNALSQLELSTGEEECILRRVITRDGRSRAFVNGSPTPLQTLRDLGEALVDIHGQNTHLSLLRSDGQRALLDSFGGHERIVAQLTTLHRELATAQDALDALLKDEEDREGRIDFLTFQLDELNDAGVDDPTEFERLGNEHRRLSSASELKTACERIRAQLAQGEGATVSDVLHNALADLAPFADIDPRLKDLHELLTIAATNVQEANVVLRAYLERDESDESAIESIDRRLSVLHDLARKHRIKPEALAARRSDLQAEFETLQGAGQSIEALRTQLDEAEVAYLKLAKSLHRKRANAAKKLATAASKRLDDLGIKGGALRIDVEDNATRAGHGTDRVEFFVRTNPGRPFGPLSKTASGGELSRIGLAIHVVAANAAELPCLIFDEVDAGIGGEIAVEVGRYLSELADRRQVLCVTHLPQVAAHANHHLSVRKRIGESSANTEIQPVVENARVEELARMLGGNAKNRQSVEHARAMLEASRSSVSPR
ncbi:MAG: DNA repair protein RecN [Gammaproteobacteria bacterium]|nr:DNA repair protein RecN [Gammaproteobacteria bacterium]